MLSIFSQIKLHAEDSPERHLSQQRAEQDQQQCSCIVGYGWVLRWSSYFASGILAGFPWAKERCMVQAVSGSTPITLASGFRSFTAVATPAKSPPPPQQTTTVSRSGTYEDCTLSFNVGFPQNIFGKCVTLDVRHTPVMLKPVRPALSRGLHGQQ